MDISEFFRNFAHKYEETMSFDITEMTDLSGEMAHIYSVTLKGEEQTLLEQFFEDNAEYEEEINTIVQKIMVMGNETGCRYEFFKHHEGLNEKAMQMREIASRINKAIIEKDIVIEEDGSLTINYWEDEDDE